MNSSDPDHGTDTGSGQNRKEASFAMIAAKLADDLTANILSGAVLLILIFTVVSIIDISGFNSRGMDDVKERDLNKLMKMNPDVTAWLSIDGTRIDNPVVQGKDNFEDLDLDIYRNYYAGGTLFLDHENSRDYSDSYNVIHGHHMSQGAMFGDLDRFLDEDFLKENCTGILTTPEGRFSLDIIAAGTADAYDAAVYSVKGDMSGHIKALLKAASCIRRKGRLKSMKGSRKSRRKVEGKRANIR